MQAHQYVPAGEGRDYDYAQDHCYVKVASTENGGSLCMVEDFLKPGFYLPRHHHKQMTEVFYLLEGEMTLILDDGTVTLRRGDTLTIPPNIWHAAKSEGGGRMMTVFHHGRFDQYLARLAEMTDADFRNGALQRQVAEEFDIWNA